LRNPVVIYVVAARGGLLRQLYLST